MALNFVNNVKKFGVRDAITFKIEIAAYQMLHSKEKALQAAEEAIQFFKDIHPEIAASFKKIKQRILKGNP